MDLLAGPLVCMTLDNTQPEKWHAKQCRRTEPDPGAQAKRAKRERRTHFISYAPGPATGPVPLPLYL